MCLIIFAVNQHPTYKLILAANRDEFFNRPTMPAHFWEENSSILGGRDIQSGGTWLGINKNGKFIAITNFRDLRTEKKDATSRGLLSKTFLTQDLNVTDFLREVSTKKAEYNGFNLLLSDDSFGSLLHYSNISDQFSKITSGIHGLSNHLLNTPWPKVQLGSKMLSEIIKSEPIDMHDIIGILKNGWEAHDDELPDTGISYDLEKKLSPVFISMKGYGTRCSTVVLVNSSNELSFLEVSYDPYKRIIGEKRFELQLKT